MQQSPESPETIPSEGGPALLVAAGLEKSYGSEKAVNGVDLTIPERAFLTLLGPSGCGKTTILRMIAGFETPDGGTLTLDGTPLKGVPPERRPVNTVFQSYALFPHLTVAENVGFSLSLRKGETNVQNRIKRALEAVHMGDYGDRYPNELSGGQQQRIAVARAIIAEPQLLLLDEPLSALDRKMRAHLQVELKDLQRRLNIAFVYVTHDQEEAFALSDIIVVMNKGRIEQQADPHTLYHRPANTFVADFIGGSTLVEGTVRRSDGNRTALETSLGTVSAPSVQGLKPGARAALVIRPEMVSPGAGDFSLSGTVIHAVFKGERTMVGVECGGYEFYYPDDTAPAQGSTVTVSIDLERCFITRLSP